MSYVANRAFDESRTPPAAAAPGLTVRALKHELRTPINHIIGYSEMLIEDLLDSGDSEARRAAEAIRAAGGQLLQIVNDVLVDAASLDSLPPPEVLITLSAAVQRCAGDLLGERFIWDTLVRSPQGTSDAQKIRAAATRLARFAETGEFKSTE